jgi:hypothetical protein
MLFDSLFLWVLDSYCGSLPMLSLHARPGSDGFLMFADPVRRRRQSDLTKKSWIINSAELSVC